MMSSDDDDDCDDCDDCDDDDDDDDNDDDDDDEAIVGDLIDGVIMFYIVCMLVV